MSIFTSWLVRLNKAQRSNYISIIADKKLKESHSLSHDSLKSRLPIKSEHRPEFRNNYKPNTYINSNYKNKH